MMGPGYRADMWSALERDSTLSAAELARRTYGSFATAWHVRQDFGLLASSCASRGSGTPARLPSPPASLGARRRSSECRPASTRSSKATYSHGRC
jgi:hypothetical protein